MAEDKNTTKKSSKKSKFERKICPECGRILQRHGSYGKNKIIRYTCKNPECSIKTISSAVLLKAQSNKNKYQKIFTVIMYLLDSLAISNRLYERIGISDKIANKFIRKVLEHHELAIDKYIPSLYVFPELLKKIIDAYNLNIPYIVIFPTIHEEFYCCVVDPNIKSVNRMIYGFDAHFEDLITGIGSRLIKTPKMY